MAVTLERLNSTIAAIYGAVGAADGFQHALQQIRTLLNGSSGMLFTPLRDAAEGGFGFVDHLNTDLFAQYRSYYWDKDPWGTEAKRKGLWYEGSTGSDELLISQREFRKHEIYADYLTKLDTVRLCFTVVAGDGNRELPGTHLSIYRGLGSRPFSAEDCRVLALLRPHIANALHLACRLQLAEVQASSAWQALSLLRSGIVLIAGDGMVVFMNEAAERLLTGDHGLFAVRQRANRCQLRARSPDDDRKLQEALGTALRPEEHAVRLGSKSSVVIGRNGAHGPLLATAVPLPARLKGELGGMARAAVLLESPAVRAGAGGDNVLAALYGATDSEGRVADALVAGHRAKTIAVRMGVAESTIRSHIKALYAKTGTRGLPDLVSLLTRVRTTVLDDRDR